MSVAQCQRFAAARAPSLLFDDRYAAIVDELARARRAAGLSQRELARRLGRAQSHVCRIESRERRVDILEFCRIADALGLDPAVLFAGVLARVRGAAAAA